MRISLWRVGRLIPTPTVPEGIGENIGLRWCAPAAKSSFFSDIVVYRPENAALISGATKGD